MPQDSRGNSSRPKFARTPFKKRSSPSGESRSSSYKGDGFKTGFKKDFPARSSAPRTGGFASRPASAGSSTSSRPSFSNSRSSYAGSRSSGGSSRPSTGGGSRPSFGGSRFGGSSRGGSSAPRRSGKNANMGQYIHPSKFVNKAIITEEVEHFIPEHQFTDFAITDEVKNAVVAKGYITPTPIQDKAIPHVLRGSDVVGIANTGTGKTAAFLVPLIHKVRLNPQDQVLIIVPTRELALQIDSELKGLTRGMKMFSVVCVGGANIQPQISALKYKNSFVIGTPGRLKDLIERGKITLGNYGTIVLDEADRMLDMGFIHDMRFVMQNMQKNRQTLFFSATLSPEIEQLIGEFLHEPVRIKVTTGTTAKSVDQDVVSVGGKDKLDVLHDLLTQKEFNKVIVFGRTKHGVEKLAKSLTQRGFKAESIHGNKSHSQRQRSLNNFKENKAQILVATDVAARGLDIADVSHVINFDIPMTYEDYVHRVGRTGRGNKKGKALTFID